eukprot:3336909-Rhodomonas_salina.2
MPVPAYARRTRHVVLTRDMEAHARSKRCIQIGAMGSPLVLTRSMAGAAATEPASHEPFLCRRHPASQQPLHDTRSGPPHSNPDVDCMFLPQCHRHTLPRNCAFFLGVGEAPARTSPVLTCGMMLPGGTGAQIVAAGGDGRFRSASILVVGA